MSRPKGLSPTQRTLRALRERGCHCDIVERFNAHAGPFGKRFDLFGIIDLVALYPEGIAGIQSCGQDFAAHNRKILESDMALEWMKHGILELWGWRKVLKNRGGKLKVWAPRVHRYTPEDFDDTGALSEPSRHTSDKINADMSSHALHTGADLKGE